ncbi:hypothetical protein vfu_A02583 [Vibrio furnissii NCTC 11218]|nr:hypothetical protein vfu_A02583 [Vibrio furnissii NCTC 11218]
MSTFAAEKSAKKISSKRFTFLYPLQGMRLIYLSTKFVDKCVNES